jgi:hypothetical protein
MASDFSVTWQFLSKRTIDFFMDQTPRPFNLKILLEFEVIICITPFHLQGMINDTCCGRSVAVFDSAVENKQANTTIHYPT